MRLIIISTPIGFLGSGKGGGVEITLNSLVSGLLEKGHSVKVIAPYRSKLSEKCNGAELICVKGKEPKSWQHQSYYSQDIISEDSIINKMLEKALSLSCNSDVIVNLSYDLLPIQKTIEFHIPIAHLISMGDESYAVSNEISRVYSKFPYNFAFHSNIQAADYPFIKNPIILGNGFQLSNYTFRDCLNGPLGWIGRVAPEKGLEDAVYVANELQEKINVWGYIQDEDYALKVENLYSSELISWKGFLSTNRLQEELGICRALINTPKWNEAYGNVVVEAMACGVPVVSYKRGGPSEIIEHGKTGFLVEPDNKKDLIRSLKVIDTIKRKECRKWVERNASTVIFAEKIIKWLSKVIKMSKTITK